MKKTLEKVKSSVGETISEVLIALLISSVGLIMLAGMISASGNVISRSRTVLENYYSNRVTASSVEGATVTITNTTETKTYGPTVNVTGKTLGGITIVSYAASSDGGTAP